jgi:L-carnitine CoA-transferase
MHPVNWLTDGIQYERVGAHSDEGVAVGYYQCKDTGIYLSCFGPAQQETLLGLLGLEYGSEEYPKGIFWVKLHTPAGQKMKKLLDEYCAARTADEVEEEFVRLGLPCSKVLDYAMAEKHPHYLAREVFVEFENTKGRKIKGLNIFPKLKKFPGKIWRGCPTVGMDNEDILSELGISDEEIQNLKDKKIIGYMDITSRRI